MAELQGDNITNSAGTGAPNFPFGFTGVTAFWQAVNGSTSHALNDGGGSSLAVDASTASADPNHVFNYNGVDRLFPVAGTYLIFAGSTMDGNNGSVLFTMNKTFINIVVGSTTYVGMGTSANSNGSGIETVFITGMRIVVMNGTDYLWAGAACYGSPGGGASIANGSNEFIQVFKLG